MIARSNTGAHVRDELSGSHRTSSEQTADLEQMPLSSVAARLHASDKRRFCFLSQLVSFLTYDFCPFLNRFLNWSKHPIGFLTIAGLVSATFALFLNAFAWVAFGAIALILTLGLVWPWIALKSLDARLSWDAKRVCEHEPVKVRLKIRNHWFWPVWGLTVQGGLRQKGASTALARVGGMSDIEFAWEFMPDERGVYPVEVPQLETGFPFGLWRARQAIIVEQELLVWPATMQLDCLPDMTFGQRSEGRLSDRQAGELGDILGTRGFREGDSLRRVHWAQSARHQRLVVTERQSGVDSRVCVRIDVSEASHVGSGPDSTLNWTLRFAASICQTLNQDHTHVDCVFGDEAICLDQTGGFRRLMDSLARLPENGLKVKASATQSRRYDCCEIVCTTDRFRHTCDVRFPAKRRRRDVVLAAGNTASDTSTAETSEHRSPWLFVSSVGIASSEFPRQWQRACRIA